MLRRDFIRVTFISAGGLYILGNIPDAAAYADVRKIARPKSRKLCFHGHRKSGCASRPELSRALENGFSSLPL